MPKRIEPLTPEQRESARTERSWLLLDGDPRVVTTWLARDAQELEDALYQMLYFLSHFHGAAEGLDEVCDKARRLVPKQKEAQ